MSAERWARIPGFSSYEVSDGGRIRSWKSGRPRLLHGWTNRLGYCYVTLVDDLGVSRLNLLHIYVAQVFIGPRPFPKAMVRHLDGNPSNNALANLAYGTSGQNQDDSVRHGTHAQAVKTTCKRGHDFTPENTRIEVRANGRRARHCRTCVREADLMRVNRPH